MDWYGGQVALLSLLTWIVSGMATAAVLVMLLGMWMGRKHDMAPNPVRHVKIYWWRVLMRPRMAWGLIKMGWHSR
jgi:hypothetical protein